MRFWRGTGASFRALSAAYSVSASFLPRRRACAQIVCHGLSAAVRPISCPSRPRGLGLLRLRAEGSRCVALGSVRPGERALPCQLLDTLLVVVRARERREKRHDVVDVVLGQREGLDVLV